MPVTPQSLRVHAIQETFFPPSSLAAAVMRMGFVQADPIRAPARAQDLILRQRVDGYRAGDLEREYPSLDIDEDLLYAYGFVSRETWRLLHPRARVALPRLDRKVLEIVQGAPVIHPRDLDAHLGKRRVVNAWGGFSRATKSALERLHFRGHLRVARRESGVRMYEIARPPDALPAESRLRGLLLATATVLAPVSQRTLLSIAARLRHRTGITIDHRRVLKALLAAGELEHGLLDREAYVWRPVGALPDEAPRTVRLLAPFDPLVWDRRRFEHLWGWSYRFEAYTPAARRLRGYYALPLLWSDAVIGWANVSAPNGTLDVDLGFVGKRPRDRAFSQALDEEIARLSAFLQPR